MTTCVAPRCLVLAAIRSTSPSNARLPTISGNCDLAHVKELIVGIGGTSGASYELQLVNTQVVPEPGTLGLLGLGLASLLGYCRMRKPASA